MTFLTITNSPSVSVIMPNFNKGQYISGAIESVLSQSLSNLELIIVDDGSTDSSLEIARGHCEKDSRIVLFSHSNNMGAGAARNLGIRKAKADVIALIDSDDLYSPEKLERQLDLLLNQDQTVVYTDWWRLDGDGRTLPSFHKDHIKKSGMLFGDLLVESLSINTTIMARKSSFIEAGMFDEALAWGEDHDFLLRLSMRFPFEYLDEKLYGYRVYEGNMRNNLERSEIFYYKALVTEKNLKLGKKMLNGKALRRVRRKMVSYYSLSHQYQKLLASGLTDGDSLEFLGNIALKKLRVKPRHPKSVSVSMAKE